MKCSSMKMNMKTSNYRVINVTKYSRVLSYYMIIKKHIDLIHKTNQDPDQDLNFKIMAVMS